MGMRQILGQERRKTLGKVVESRLDPSLAVSLAQT